MINILGIDPGSRIFGFAIINESKAITWGQVALGNAILPARLLIIEDQMRKICRCYRPDVMAIENVFMGKNAKTLVTQSQARGVFLLIAAQFGLKVFEYAPNTIKKKAAHSGRADKNAVAKSVKKYFSIKKEMGNDASDALAIALTCYLKEYYVG